MSEKILFRIRDGDRVSADLQILSCAIWLRDRRAGFLLNVLNRLILTPALNAFVARRLLRSKLKYSYRT
jgi:hypothetical protein